MPRSTVEIKKFDGLYLQANSFSSVPDGALEQAKNIVVSNDRKLYKRRGFYEYYDPDTDTAVALFYYQGKLILVNTDSIGYFTDSGDSPNEVGTVTELTGVTVETTALNGSKSGQFNDNLYFTTENGILKIESYDGTILRSGVAPGLDLRGKFVSGSAIATDKAVSYRVLFGRRDAYDQLYIGAPSDYLTLTNTLGVTADAELEFSIPAEMTSTDQSWFFQLYRSTTVASGSTPPQDYKLIKEQKLTSVEIARGVVYHRDSLIDLFLGAELYTNPNSREGEQQANAKPPKCKDIAVYKNHVIYANTVSRHILYFDVIDPGELSTNDYIEFQIDSNQYRFVVVTDGSNEPIGNQTVSATASGTGTITITYNNHGLSNGYEVYLSNITGTLTEGLYTISAVTANTFQITATGETASALDVECRTNGTYPIFWADNTSSTPSIKIRNTAVHLAKALNRDDTTPIYAKYISTPTGVPGKLSFQSQDFGEQIEVKVNDSTSQGAFDPILPTTYDESYVSSNDELPHGFFSSKISEPEAVPTVNFYTLGSRNAEIQRVIALRDSLIIIKEDGVYRVTGDTVDSFSITTLDNTVFCVAPKSVALINNQIVFLSNQGFCLVTESSVQIISRKIEDVVTPILGISTLAEETAAIAYESERLYLVSTIKPNETTATVVYCYNMVTDAWTTWDNTFDNGIIGAYDALYIINSDGLIHKERKKQTRLDYCGQNYSLTVNSVSTDKLSANITMGLSIVPQPGDVILKNNIFTRVNTVTLNGSSFDMTFSNLTNLEALDEVNLYSFYESIIKLAPFHAGKISVVKHFSECQIHLGSDELSALELTFAGNYFGGSTPVDWAKVNIIGAGTGGWGFEPWGFFSWGLTDGINITTGTRPAIIVRTYIPRFQARSTFIQPSLRHSQAGEKINIQAIGFTLRAYGERTSK